MIIRLSVMHLALSSPPQSLPLLLSFRITKQLQAYDLTDGLICKHGVPKTQMCSVSVLAVLPLIADHAMPLSDAGILSLS